MSVNKKFDKNLSNKWDMFGKEIAAEVLHDIYGLDLLGSLKDQKEMFSKYDFTMRFPNSHPTDDLANRYIEAEVKIGWTEKSKWQGWPTIDVAYRKKKSDADVFVMVNKHGTAVAIAPMSLVTKQEYYKEKRTIYSNGKLEPFFAVPLDIFLFYTNSSYTNGWARIKPTGEITDGKH